MKLNLTPFFFPAGDSGGDELIEMPDPSVSDKEILEQEDEDPDPDPDSVSDPDPDPEDEPEIKEIKDDDEEEKEEVEEEDELKDDVDENAPVTGVKFKDLKKDYPDIFKKHPGLAAVINEHRAITEIFSSPEDAQEAQDNSEFFQGLEQDIMSGNAEKLMESVHRGDPKALENLAVDMVERIRDNNERLYAKLTVPAIVGILNSAVRDAEAAGNTNLKHAALFVAKYIWGKPEIPTLEKTEKKDNTESDKVKLEREAFEEEKAQDFRDDVMNSAFGNINSEITGRFDPKDARLTPYLKKTLSKDVLAEVNLTLDNDVAHNRKMDSLYARSKATGFSRESRRQFVNAYLQAAKALVPGVLAKQVREAVGVKGKQDVPTPKVKVREEREERQPRREAQRQPDQRPQRHTPSAREIDWKRTTDKMLLDDKYVPARRR